MPIRITLWNTLLWCLFFAAAQVALANDPSFPHIDNEGSFSAKQDKPPSSTSTLTIEQLHERIAALEASEAERTKLKGEKSGRRVGEEWREEWREESGTDMARCIK